MEFLSRSIRTHVVTFITLMGVVTLVLLITSAWAFRHFSWESHRFAIERLTEQEVASLLNELSQNSSDMALRMQHESHFRQAYQRRDITTLIRQLNDQFHQYYHTSGIILIRRLQIFDTDFSLVAESTGTTSGPPASQAVCPHLIRHASRRRGGDRLKPISSLCVMDGTPLYAVLAPIGGLRLSGYVLVASDPTPVLEQLEEKLGAAIRLVDGQGLERYRSPRDDTNDHAFSVHYPVLTRQENSRITSTST